MHNAGYYGKVPVLGDFVKYNLPRSFIEPWDDWLQQAINARNRQQQSERHANLTEGRQESINSVHRER